MDEQLTLHIGANKTGSSAIQRFIRANAALLRAHGFAVPDADLGWSGQVTGFHVFALQALINGRDPQAITERFDALMAGRPEGAGVLLSAENLSNPGNHALFAGVCARYPTRVILYVRRQDELFASSWQQWHAKIESDLDAWVIKALRTLGHWEETIAGWESVAGAGSVSVAVFEREDFPDGNVMADFLGRLGIDADTAGPVYPAGEVNPSFSDIITPLVAGNRAIFRDSNDNEFFDTVRALTGDAYVGRPRVSLLSAAQRDNIVAFYAAENERVCRRHFPGRPRLFRPVDHGAYRYLDEGEMLRAQLGFVTAMLYGLARRLPKG